MSNERDTAVEKLVAVLPSVEERGWVISPFAVSIYEDGSVHLQTRGSTPGLLNLLQQLDPSLNVTLHPSTGRHVVVAPEMRP